MHKEQSLDVGFVFLDYQEHNLYQLRQWIQPLERLATRFSIKVFYTSPFVALELERSSLEGAYFEGQDELIESFNRLSPKVLLYANQNVRNFFPLRFPKAVHAFVSHGESDKAYMSQNTLKRYDLYFAAGQAAVDRISAAVANYESSKRIIQIGRPQSLDQYTRPSDLVESDKKRILYAPTWEGVTKATRYTSISSHGRNIVQSLIQSGKYQVTYRPHPLSGSRDLETKKANNAIKQLILSANKRDDTAGHYIDKSPFGWHLSYHDLLISDISAIAYDWLSTEKPILLTKPVEKKAIVADFPLVESLYSITANDSISVDGIVSDQFEPESNHQSISKKLTSYYFKQPTELSDEFLTEAIKQAISLADQHNARHEFPRLGSFESRGGALGFLRYPNFVIREALRLTGSWSTSKQLEKLSESEEIFVHLSDPFNGNSLIPVFRETLRAHPKGKKLVLISNQVTSWLQVQKLLKKVEFKELARDVLIIPVANATDCETVIAKLKPKKAFYLKHHPLNHMLLRINGLEHVLWKPELDPLFSPDHSISTYDKIEKPTNETLDYINNLFELSRPEIVR